MRRPSRPALLAGLCVLATALMAASLLAGKVWIPWSAWRAGSADPLWPILADLRLPRTLLGLAVGAALGGAGAALQGYTRNPLADPGVLGVSSCAALGAVLTLYYGLTATSPLILPLSAMAGAALGSAFLLALAGASSGMVVFLLSGVVLQTTAGAAVALAVNLSPSPWAVTEIVNWLMGSLAGRSMEEVALASPFIAAGLALLLSLGRSLDALSLGEMGARSLGVNLERARIVLAGGLALAVGASVAVTGVIGFVGLVAPHLVRPLAGPRPSALVAPSALAGAALVLAADVAVRLAPSAAEVKLGVAMAAVGGPFFLALLVGLRRRLA